MKLWRKVVLAILAAVVVAIGYHEWDYVVPSVRAQAQPEQEIGRQVSEKGLEQVQNLVFVYDSQSHACWATRPTRRPIAEPIPVPVPCEIARRQMNSTLLAQLEMYERTIGHHLP
jgi:hypothetical protein